MSAPANPPPAAMPPEYIPSPYGNTPPARAGLVVSRALRVCAAILTLVVSMGSWYGASALNTFEMQGVAVGLPPGNSPIIPGQDIGMQVFLNKEADPDKIRRTVDMLREGGVTWVREVFDWCELEHDGRGQYWDQANNRPSFQKYDFIVDQLTQAHIRILARLDNAPAWSSPGVGTGQCRRGPPTDLNTYTDFVRKVTTQYRGKLAAVQIWNEPNLSEEWGSLPVNVVQYTDMLKRSYAAAKDGDPNVLVVTATLAPTLETDLSVGLSDLAFYDQMYQAGAKGFFDVLGVNVYGLDQPPDDRRASPERINVSRPLLVRQIMEQHDDEKTPMWATEFGYISLPSGWDGKESIWKNVDETTQARYLVGGLDRMTSEWPWMGVVFVWGFRWTERPGTFGKDPNNPVGPKEPEPYFAVVNYDFTPRPAWLAIRAFARNQGLRPGQFAATDPLIRTNPGWVRGTDGTSNTLVGTGTDATATIVMQGTQIAAIGEGAVRVAVDGRDRGMVRLVPGKMAMLAADLSDDTHTLTLHPANANAPARLQQLLVGRQPPFAWAFPLFTLGALLAGLGAVGVLALELTRTIQARRLATGWQEPLYEDEDDEGDDDIERDAPPPQAMPPSADTHAHRYQQERGETAP